MITIVLLHYLDPLDSDLELLLFVYSFVDRKICSFTKTVKACAPVDVELQLLLDLVSDTPEDILSHFLGVIRQLGFKLDGVFVDTLDACLIEFDLEVVGEKFQSFASCLCISGWSLREESDSI